MAEHGPARWTGGKKSVAAVGSEETVPAREAMIEAAAEMPPSVELPIETEPGAPPAIWDEQAEPEIDATDAARTLAAEHNVDLATVEGTGFDGRITKDDVAALLVLGD